MDQIGKFKEEITEALNNIVRLSIYKGNAGRFDINKDAEEFYRGLLNLFYGWNLKNANTEKNPNYEGVDLLYMGNQITVQVTSENDSDKVHQSISGFKEKAFLEGYKELYILMFKGKKAFPKADFQKTVNAQFTFINDKHIIDHSDLCKKLKDAEFIYVENIWKYLKKWKCLPYSNIDESSEDLGIIGEIFEYLFNNLPKKTSSYVNDSEVFAKLKIKIPLNFPKEQENRLSEMVKNTTDKRLIVEKYLAEYEDEIKILDLREWIQSKYCEIREVSNHEEPIKDVSFIEKLAKSILSQKTESDSYYQGNAKAIIIHFFEFCYIGKKTKIESNQQLTLFG